MEKKSKLVLAVLQGSDSDNTIRNLNERGFMVTVLSSTGGFLKKKSTTVMIGVEEDLLDSALELLQKYAGRRKETVYQSVTMPHGEMSSVPPVPMEVMAGGFEWLAQNTVSYPVGTKVSMRVIPENIQIMNKPQSEDEEALALDE
mgnify:CR=1 FL=1